VRKKNKKNEKNIFPNLKVFKFDDKTIKVGTGGVNNVKIKNKINK